MSECACPPLVESGLLHCNESQNPVSSPPVKRSQNPTADGGRSFDPKPAHLLTLMRTWEEEFINILVIYDR